MSKITSLAIETNLGFTFERQAAAADTTLYLKFFNRVTGAATEPIAGNRTNLIVVADKGSESSPNPNYEIIVLGTVGAASGGVSTCTSVTRGVTFATTAITAGTGKIHQAGAVGGCADVADLWWQALRVLDGTYGTNANNLRVGAEAAADVSFYVQNDQTVNPRLYFDDSDKRFKISWGDDAPAAGDVDGVGVPSLTTAERDALTWPTGGVTIYNTTLGYTQFREGGAWVANVSGATVADSSETVAGKVEEATSAESLAGTDTGGTSAPVFVRPSHIAANIQNNAFLFAADAEASDTYVITLVPAIAAYATGQRFVFTANTANTGACTLNVNGKGAKAIVKGDSTALVTGDIAAGQVVEVVYDGTNMVMTSLPNILVSGGDDGVSHYHAIKVGSGSVNIAGNGATNIAHGLGRIPKIVTMTATTSTSIADTGDGTNVTIYFNGTTQSWIGLISTGAATSGFLSGTGAVDMTVGGTKQHDLLISANATNIILTAGNYAAQETVYYLWMVE